MTVRARDASLLTPLLRERTGVAHVVCARTRAGGWRVSWCNGPTEAEMRRVAASLVDQVPAPGVDGLTFDRVTTDLARAVAVLLYLNAHPSEARHIGGFARRWAVNKINYPERAGELWLCRARALLMAEREFYSRVRHACCGWELALGWLDAVAGINPIEVASIAEAHDRRHRYRS